MKDSFVIESETDGVPAPFYDEKEKALQRIASSLERLELILRQLGGQKIRLSALEHPVHKEPKSTEETFKRR